MRRLPRPLSLLIVFAAAVGCAPAATTYGVVTITPASPDASPRGSTPAIPQPSKAPSSVAPSVAASPSPSPSPSPSSVVDDPDATASEPVESPTPTPSPTPITRIDVTDGATLVPGGHLSLARASGALLPAYTGTESPPVGPVTGSPCPTAYTGTTSTVTLEGVLKVPGGLAGGSGSLPVSGATLHAVGLDGRYLTLPVHTDTHGRFSIKVPPSVVVALRTQFTVDGQLMYFSALDLVAASGVPAKVTIGPISTVIESKFLALCAGALPGSFSFIAATYFPALATATADLDGFVTPTLFRWPTGAGPIADAFAARAAAYDAIAGLHPTEFTHGLSELVFPTPTRCE